MLFMSCVCRAFASVHCCLVVTCWERADFLFVMFNCVFVTFPCGILGQMWYLIVLISDLCRLLVMKKLKIGRENSNAGNSQKCQLFKK